MQMQDLEIIDRHGRRRRARPGETLADGERFALPMQMMDHSAFGFSRTFSDGSIDHTSPHQPGYRFADTNDAARLAAEEAYRERSARMQDAWRTRGQQQDVDPNERVPRGTRPTHDEARAAADQAYRDRSARMQNAWHTNKEA